MSIDYTEVTEVPGAGATTEQHDRLLHRYNWATSMASGKRALEVACGAGFGLGGMRSVAGTVVGGDYTLNLLRIAKSHYGSRVPFTRLDGQHLPYRGGSFDLVLIFEAIYYLPDVDGFIREAHRVLAGGGRILVASANREWDEFASSPHSTKYLSARELSASLHECGFLDAQCFGVFPTGGNGVLGRAISLIRRAVVALRLMPRTLEGRARLKRWVYGPLKPLPAELELDVSVVQELARVDYDRGPVLGYKVLYCVGQKAP